MSVLLVTLGLALVLENVALALFSADFKTVQTDLSIATFKVQGVIVSVPRLVGLGAMLLDVPRALPVPHAHHLGRAIRATGRTARWRGSWGSTTSMDLGVAYGLSAALMAIAARRARAVLLRASRGGGRPSCSRSSSSSCSAASAACRAPPSAGCSWAASGRRRPLPAGRRRPDRAVRDLRRGPLRAARRPSRRGAAVTLASRPVALALGGGAARAGARAAPIRARSSRATTTGSRWSSGSCSSPT